MARKRNNIPDNTMSRIKQAVKCRSGIAATEFALLLPIMVILFFGLIQAADALTMNRRVNLAANTLADLTAQASTLSPSEIDSLLAGIINIMEPNDTTNLTINLVSVVLTGGNPTVHWSRNRSGGPAYSVGSIYPNLEDSDVLNSNGSLIIVEVTYPYVPSLGSHLLDTTILFERKTVRWPRLVDRIQFCVTPGSCTT